MIYAKNLPAWECGSRILVGRAAPAWAALVALSTPVPAAAAGACRIVGGLPGVGPGCAPVGRGPIRP